MVLPRKIQHQIVGVSVFVKKRSVVVVKIVKEIAEVFPYLVHKTGVLKAISAIERNVLVKVPGYLKVKSTFKHSPRSLRLGTLGVILGASFLMVHFVQASDVNKVWDFSNQSDYTIGEESELEYSGSSVRLKAQNYTSDASTAALYHFDESSGSTAEDSSSHSGDLSLSNATWGIGQLNNGLTLNGTTSSASAPDSNALSLTQSNTLEGWTKLNSTFSAGSQQTDQPIIDKGAYKLYYDHETGKPTYELENASATNWTQVAGNDVNGSWDINGKSTAQSSIVIGSDLYVGTGAASGDAEVWKYNGSNWTQVGGDGLNSSWANFTYEEVASLATDGTNLYAGTGSSAGDAEVWRWNGSSWTKIGGDTLNSSWALATYDYVHSLSYYGGNLYAGLGFSTNEAEVWRWNGSSWSQIGGDGLNGGWTGSQQVKTLQNDGTNLYAGVGIVGTAGAADVWRWNGSSWSQIGGDGLNSSWAASTYEEVLSSFYQAGNLYIGLGTSAGDAEIWRWNGSTWSRLGYGGSPFTAATYEGVYSISGDGTNIYAGLGLSQGDGDVWRYNGSSWSQIGGDGLNSGWTQGYFIYTMAWYNSKLFADSTQASSGDVMFSWNGSSWTREAGQYYNGSWGYNNLSAVRSMTTAGGKLYAGLQSSGAGGATVFEYNGSSWRLIGAPGLNSAWGAGTYTSVLSMTSSGSDIYVGLNGSGNSDGEVWKWNGSSWSQIGGDGLNGGWNTVVSLVSSLAYEDGILYAGIGSSNNNGDVWKLESGSWSRIGGGGLNGGWNNAYRSIPSMGIYQGDLVIGAYGSVVGSADAWRWNGSAWTQIGGDGVNSSWSFGSTFNTEVSSLIENNGKLYAAITSFTVGDAAVWEYNGSSWTKIGGDEINSSWASTTYDRASNLASYNGEIYAGLGTATGNGEVWKYSNGSWSQSGGDGLNASWANTVETARVLQVYKGKLYAGLGDSQNADAMIYSLGNNGYLQGSSNSQDTNWNHLAATYDGSTMKIFKNGVQEGSQSIALSIPNTATSLQIGRSYGSSGGAKPQATFNGSLDEIRISSTARTSFTTKPYTSERTALELAAADYKTGIASWDDFSSSETTNGGTITYQLSDSEGDSWKYWNGTAWVESGDLSQSNSVAEISDHIATFPISHEGISWRAVFDGDGDQRVQLNSVTLAATADSTPPATNASDIVMKRSPSGATVTENEWTNAEEPYFSWSPANDSQSAIRGYCLYLGMDSNADPVTTKGLLGTSPLPTHDECQFIIGSESIDLSTSSYLGAALSTSNSPYYLKIKAVDEAGNIYNTESETFSFKFDNTQPDNPLFISAPSQFLSSKQVTVTWPTSDSNAPSDNHSGIAGLQYKIGSSGTWYGDGHTGAQDSSDLLANDGSYQTIDPEDFNNLNDGNNTIYFRTYDVAGNVTTAYATGVVKINTSSPTSPRNITSTPEINSLNSFAFSWQAPASYFGDAQNLTYCYTINTTPSANTCTYTEAGVTELEAGAFATQPGENTFYVVAKDEAGNVNYATAASTTFTANTSAPGIPRNSDVVDISVKSTSNWRLALSWDEPEDTGAGVANYKIYRSTDNTTFTNIASTAGTSYVDGGLSQQRYYYKVRACDSANNCGAYGSVVDAQPTGKYTTPAVITSEPRVSNISTRKATIDWATDRESDSRIQYGTKSGQYFSTEAAISEQVTSHEVLLNNLTAGTTYYAKAKWTDEDGNTGQTAEFTFKTADAPVVKEVTSDPSLTGADIKFTSKDATKVKIYYGKSESFGGTKSLNTSLSESDYVLTLDGLDDGSKYFFKLNTLDSDGNEYEGNVYSFTTPPRPQITNLRFQPVKDQPSSTQKVSWNTNVPASSELSYGIGQPSQTVTASKLTTNHELEIKGLADDSNYVLVARSRDASGNVAVSDQQRFKTDLDTRPPKISDIVVDASIRGTGAEARGQVVVSWKTDEPATSQVAYGEGSSGFLSNSTSEDAKLSTEHVVVVSDLSTSRVYHFEPRSFDRGRNEAKGEQQVAIIGRASENVLSIIFNALQKIFGIE